MTTQPYESHGINFSIEESTVIAPDISLLIFGAKRAQHPCV